MIVIALGANLPSKAGPPEKTFPAALHALKDFGVEDFCVSSFYRTPAWPDPSDPAFLNAVAFLKTALAPAALMQALHAVEAAFGRVRSRPNAPRTLDLDLIDYDGLILESPLVLPHPRMQTRAFVLVPLAEIAPDWRHPISGRNAAELLAALPEADCAAIVRA